MVRWKNSFFLYMYKYYQLSVKQTENLFKTSSQHGLSLKKVEENRAKFGVNKLDEAKKESILRLFVRQLENPIVLMLLVVVGIAAVTGEIVESVLIAGIVSFMALSGVYLEYKAGDAIGKLKKMTSVNTQVIRAGKFLEIPVEEVVAGDLISLKEGDRVPADCRIVFANEAEVDESSLTGESLSVNKKPETINEELVLADQKNMLFGGTFILGGNVRAIVVRVGGETELGRIAKAISETEEKPTPLQKQLIKLNFIILWGTLFVCGIILILTVIRGEPLLSALIEVLSLAIAFIPEGLGAVMTVTLAMGVKEMAVKKVIIKRLIAAEGLGSISLLATDKTGTITQNKMTVEKLWVIDQEIKSEGFKSKNLVEQKMIEIIRFCNNSKGATELALINFLEKIGLSYEIEERYLEHRFSSDLKRMMVVKKNDQSKIGYSKGAPDVLVHLCSKYLDSTLNKEFGLTEKIKEKVLKQTEVYALAGYRVLLLAYREFKFGHEHTDRRKDECDLVFVGLVGLMDPIRPEVKETVANLKKAGIRPVVITGDHPQIAKTIACQAGIVGSDAGVMTGDELEKYFNGKSKYSEDDIVSFSLFARVTPMQKNKLVDLYVKKGMLTAMAGDGVNDAVAISKCHVGIAMNAVDVVNESADVVIYGGYDALASAVEIGRVIVQRTRLYLHYILSGNVCEVGVFILALIFNTPLPMTAIMLLIINLLTDAAPAMAMAFEKKDKDIMSQQPRSATEGIINGPIWVSIAVQGMISSAFLFLVFIYCLPLGLVVAQTATFTAYMFQKLLRAFTARSFTRSVFEYGFLSNRFTVIAVVFAFFVWLVMVYGVPGWSGTAPIPSLTLLWLFLLSLIFPVIEEVMKFTRRKKRSLVTSVTQ